MHDGDFDLRALYDALDVERNRRGLSWAALTREVNRQFERVPVARPLSSSTIIGVGRREVVEGDGVLQMLRWLERTPESFVAGHESSASDPDAEALPVAPPEKVLRWDAAAIHAAVDSQRQTRSLTWDQVAQEMGCGANALRGLANGGRVSLPAVMRIIGWLHQPAAAFVRPTDW